MDKRDGRVMVITGGSRGIGRATALRAAQEGWSVAINYRSDQAMADETVGQVVRSGSQACATQGDVSVEADVARLFDAALERFGRIDGVVVNAGVVAPSSTLAEMSSERLRRMIDVNVLGALYVAREAARCLPQAAPDGGASIVFVSSAAARLGSPCEYVDYAASKGAVDTLTIGLAKELAPANIRVNAVRPGLIESEIHASGGQPDRAWRLGRSVPMGRPGSAEEVANAIVWLCSAEASYVTGALLDVAGGR